MTCLVWDSVEQTVWSLFVFHRSTLQQCHNRSQTTSEAPPGCLEHTRLQLETFNLQLYTFVLQPGAVTRLTVYHRHQIWSGGPPRASSSGFVAVEVRRPKCRIQIRGSESSPWDSSSIRQYQMTTDYGNTIMVKFGIGSRGVKPMTMGSEALASAIL